MKLKLVQKDPLRVLSSTKFVVENARHVSINPDNLDKAAKKIANRFKRGLGVQEMGFFSTNNLEDDIQLVFLENVVNFCFWASKGQPKWQVKFEENITESGWIGLTTCFKRGLKEGLPILNAEYISSISLEDTRRFFRGIGGLNIPLLQERMQNLQEAGRVLAEKFDGRASNVLEQSSFNAIKLAKLVSDNFLSFRDISYYNGKEAVFLKRAQILSDNLGFVLKDKGKKIEGLDELTAFADYKLPQILRMYGILEYKKDLSDRVDNYIEIEHDSPEEIEIRASTIWAVELLRERIPDLSPGKIDNTIWLMSQSLQKEAKPYHRTRTIYY